MLEFLKRFFGYEGGAAAVSPRTPVPVAGAPPQPARIATDKSVASLSLLEILEKLPPDLKSIIDRLPDPEAKIAMRMSKIMQQLSGGAVRIPFNTLRRQSPRGTFHKTKVDRKRMVDLPLAEVLKAIDPSRLQRHPEQAEYHVPVGVVGVFSDNGQERCVADPMFEPVKILWMPGVSPDRPSGRANEPAASGFKGELSFPLVELASEWPGEVQRPLSTLSSDTKVLLPLALASRCLQKGKVAFPWSQVRTWIRPAISGPAPIPDDLELIFPLKIVALAFLAETRTAQHQTGSALDQSATESSVSTAPQPRNPEASHPTPVPAPEDELKPSLTSDIPASEDVSTPAFITEPAAIPAAESTPLKLAMPVPAPAAPVAKRRESGIVDPSVPEIFGRKAGKTCNPEASNPLPSAAPAPKPDSAPIPTPPGELKLSLMSEIAAEGEAPAPPVTTEPARVPPARDESLVFRRRTGQIEQRTPSKDTTAPAVITEPTSVPPARDETLVFRRRNDQTEKRMAEKDAAAPAVVAESARVPPARDETLLPRRRTDRPAQRTAETNAATRAVAKEPARVPPARDETLVLRRRTAPSAQRTPGKDATAPAVTMEPGKGHPARDETLLLRRRTGRSAAKAS